MEWSMLIQSPTDRGYSFIGFNNWHVQNRHSGVKPDISSSLGSCIRAKPSTGLILPILCIADLIAVLYYRRIAEWKYVFKLLPAALVGFILALLVDKVIPPAAFKHLMGGCLAIVLLVMFWSEWKGKENKLSSCWWYGPFFGLLGGFTTMIGNAAGPVMAIYLLSVKMPKYSFVGTNAWFFLVINYLKIPVQMFAWNNITSQSLIIDALTIPFILMGGVAGIFLVKRLPEKGFRSFTTAITCVSVILLLI